MTTPNRIPDPPQAAEMGLTEVTRTSPDMTADGLSFVMEPLDDLNDRPEIESLFEALELLRQRAEPFDTEQRHRLHQEAIRRLIALHVDEPREWLDHTLSISTTDFDPGPSKSESHDRGILSAGSREGVPAERMRFRTAREIAAEGSREVAWIAPPWVAKAAITEVLGKPKAAGKTTWVQRLIRSVLDGLPFMGKHTTRTRVVYLTEERRTTLCAALQRAGLLDRDDLIILRWHDTVATPWPQVMTQAITECRHRGAELLVVDTVSQFAQLSGDTENNAGHVLDAYRPLQAAAGAGIAVIAVRHERKSGGGVADSGRGSSAFAGAADILLAIRRPDGQSRPTIREIHALSRFDETPDLLAMELTDEGYVALESAAVAEIEGKAAVLKVLPTNEPDAIQLDTLVRESGVKRTTTQEVLKTLSDDGQVRSIGKGKKGDPVRYWAPQIRSAGTPSNGAAETNQHKSN
jgi:hypothetical protein